VGVRVNRYNRKVEGGSGIGVSVRYIQGERTVVALMEGVWFEKEPI